MALLQLCHSELLLTHGETPEIWCIVRKWWCLTFSFGWRWDSKRWRNQPAHPKESCPCHEDRRGMSVLYVWASPYLIGLFPMKHLVVAELLWLWGRFEIRLIIRINHAVGVCSLFSHSAAYNLGSLRRIALGRTKLFTLDILCWQWIGMW